MKRSTTKRALWLSVVSMFLCLTMFMGTTFAWFTDQAFSGKNVITSGNLDLEMYWTDDLGSGVWHNVEDEEHNTVFSYDNWEPGYVQVKILKVVNIGSLAFKWQANLVTTEELGKLADGIGENGGVIGDFFEKSTALISNLGEKIASRLPGSDAETIEKIKY